MNNLTTIVNALRPVKDDRAALVRVARGLLGEPMGDDELIVIVALALLALWQSVQNDTQPDGTIAIPQGPPVVVPVPSPSPIPQPPSGGSNPPIVTTGAGDMIDPATIVIVDDPGDMLNVPITARITSIVCEPSNVRINSDGVDGWQGVYPPGFADPIAFTVCCFLWIDGQWVGSAFIEGTGGYHGSDGVGDGMFDWVNNWWYSSRWGPMAGHQLAPGETVGICLIGGDGRDSKGPFTGQRTQIVTIQATDNGSFQF